jgi:hypothetical protein
VWTFELTKLHTLSTYIYMCALWTCGKHVPLGVRVADRLLLRPQSRFVAVFRWIGVVLLSEHTQGKHIATRFPCDYGPFCDLTGKKVNAECTDVELWVRPFIFLFFVIFFAVRRAVASPLVRYNTRLCAIV